MALSTAAGLLLAAVSLGLIEGIKPGPLMAVVISETVRHGWKSGLKVACAPLISDGPVILLAALLYGVIALNITAQATLGLLGAAVLVWLGIDCVASSNQDLDLTSPEKERSLRKGIITNLSNPNMYLYWSLVGAPFLLSAYAEQPLLPFLFIGGFFTALISLKIVIALLVNNSRDVLRSSGYLALLRISGIALFIFAGLFLRDALVLLEVL